MKQEIWKDVVGYEGLYQVSDLGRFLSKEHYIPRNGVMAKLSSKILSPCFGKRGYFLVALTKDKKKKTYGVHQLVAAAFLGERPNKHVVDHKNRDTRNNNVSNLRYVSVLGNVLNTDKRKGYHLKRPNQYCVQIKVNGKIISKGGIRTEQEAIKIRAELERIYHYDSHEQKEGM